MKYSILIVLGLFLLNCNSKSNKTKDENYEIEIVENDILLPLSQDSLNMGDDSIFESNYKNKCDVDIVMDMDKSISNYTEEQLIEFLSTLEYSCLNNAEFSEYFNEILFKSISNNPVLFIKVLNKEDENIDIDLILEEFSNPVADNIDLSKLKKKLQELEQDKITQSLISSLTTAINKYQ